MILNSTKKNKVNLSEYSVEKDIQCRQFLSELTVFEAEVLKEIIYGSLKTSTAQLAHHLEVSEQKLLPSLEKLQILKLYNLEKGKIFVDKEMRKYYESQLPKFDETFEPDLEFLKTLLSRVPIHVLPSWYAIPRTSDDIFGSIIEKHFLTPKTYQRYLDELHFDEKGLNEIVKEVFQSPTYKVRVKDLIQKHNLSKEQFERGILLLEFSLVLCLSYDLVDGCWEEVVTPFHEWRQYLLTKKNTLPSPIKQVAQIARSHPHDFGFIEDINHLLKSALNPKGVNPEVAAKKLFSHAFSSDYLLNIIKILEELELVEKKAKKETLYLSEKGNAWLRKPIQEQALAIYYYESRQTHYSHLGGFGVDKDLREIERCLKEVSELGWIYFEDFLKSCSAPIGSQEPVALGKKGKRWCYQFPQYTKKEEEILYDYIFKIFFQAGIVATGTYQKKPCICVTPFGRIAMD